MTKRSPAGDLVFHDGVYREHVRAELARGGDVAVNGIMSLLAVVYMAGVRDGEVFGERGVNATVAAGDRLSRDVRGKGGGGE